MTRKHKMRFWHIDKITFLDVNAGYTVYQNPSIYTFTLCTHFNIHILSYRFCINLFTYSFTYLSFMALRTNPGLFTCQLSLLPLSCTCNLILHNVLKNEDLNVSYGLNVYTLHSETRHTGINMHPFMEFHSLFCWICSGSFGSHQSNSPLQTAILSCLKFDLVLRKKYTQHSFLLLLIIIITFSTIFQSPDHCL
jgi:hypothetical protein